VKTPQIDGPTLFDLPIQSTCEPLMLGLGWRLKVQIKLITNDTKPN